MASAMSPSAAPRGDVWKETRCAFSSQVLRDNIAHVENPVAAVVMRTDGIGLDDHGSTV